VSVFGQQAQFPPAFCSIDTGRTGLERKNARGRHDSDTQSGMNAPANAMRLDG
jgi:hypothetical protein